MLIEIRSRFQAPRELWSGNARIAVEGRCVMHNPDVTIPATHLLEVPIGNVLPLCTPCLEWWVQDAKETGDRYSQPVSIRPRPN